MKENEVFSAGDIVYIEPKRRGLIHKILNDPIRYSILLDDGSHVVVSVDKIIPKSVASSGLWKTFNEH